MKTSHFSSTYIIVLLFVMSNEIYSEQRKLTVQEPAKSSKSSVMHIEDNRNDMVSKNHHGDVILTRMKRGIIWNKIKKIKRKVVATKKKIWRVKQRAFEVIKGKDYNTPKPKYESTGGSWGKFPTKGWGESRLRQEMSLSSQYGPPYGAVNGVSNRSFGWRRPSSAFATSAGNWRSGNSQMFRYG